MSWDASLIDDRGHYEGSWNYTHNCNEMIAAALSVGVEAGEHAEVKLELTPGILGKVIGPTWWKHLDGMTGPAGAEYLHRIITALEADPPRFQAMNPPNEWGDYDSLLRTLTEMRDRVPEWPTTWSASG